MAPKRALVTGPYGIVGLNVVEKLTLRPDWEVLAVGRRATPPVDGLAYWSSN